MILEKLFRPRTAERVGKSLYAAAVAKARSPELYADLGVPDTPEGRFEMYSLHVGLLIERLRHQGEHAAEVSQELFNAYIGGLDDAFREMGVGDLSVGKKMKKLASAFYGRLKGYDDAFAALPDRGAIESLLARVVWASEDRATAALLSSHVLDLRQSLENGRLSDVLDGNWI
jgi:cytochrome b pre-mRNA-processing protein 3